MSGVVEVGTFDRHCLSLRVDQPKRAHRGDCYHRHVSENLVTIRKISAVARNKEVNITTVLIECRVEDIGRRGVAENVSCVKRNYPCFKVGREIRQGEAAHCSWRRSIKEVAESNLKICISSHKTKDRVERRYYIFLAIHKVLFICRKLKTSILRDFNSEWVWIIYKWGIQGRYLARYCVIVNICAYYLSLTCGQIKFAEQWIVHR